MRTWLAVGLAAMALASGVDTAEARGRGFGRLFMGRGVTPSRPVAPLPAAAETRAVSRIGYQPAIVVTPGQTALAAAATAAPVVAVAATAVPAEPAPKSLRIAQPAAPPVQPVQEVRAAAPPCSATKLIGGRGQAETGFCLIN